MTAAVKVPQRKKLSQADRDRLVRLSIPRVVDPYFRHIPHPKQQFFLSLPHDEVMFGGSAGPGKSDALLMAALQYVDVPGYSALILRRTWPDLTAAGAILDRATQWFAGKDVHKHDGGRYWTFPSGARLSFGHIQHENDKLKYQSAEYQYVGFDELTQFSETQYTYLFSRIRKPQINCLTCGLPVGRYSGNYKHKSSGSKCRGISPDPLALDQYRPAKDGMSLWDVPLRMRSATNPGGPGHDWVKTRFVDPRTREQGAVFVPALLKDNPSIDQEEYLKSLSHLTALDKERLLGGDWDVTEEGSWFQRHFFDVLEQPPAEVKRRHRHWDIASTADDGDWTVGTLLSLTESGRWVVEDVVRGQWSPLQVERTVYQTAMSDRSLHRHIDTTMEQEPGASGVQIIDHFRRNILVGFSFRGVRPTGSKEVRAKPLAAAAEAGNVAIVTAAWNKAWLDELALFPNGGNDDQVDSMSGAFDQIAFGRTGRLIV